MSTTIHVIRVALRVADEVRADFLDHARQQAREVPARFDGCLQYGFHASVEGDGRYLLYQEWASSERFEDYRKSAYFAETGARLRPMLAGPPDSAYFAAERTGP